MKKFALVDVALISKSLFVRGFILFFLGITSVAASYGQEKLVIKKTTNKITANPGEEITYIINYSNAGLTAASNVVITDFLPLAGTYTYVSSSPVGKIEGNTLVWTSAEISGLASLGGGENQIIVTIKAGVPGNGTTGALSGYYIPTSTTSLDNHAEIKSDNTTSPKSSETVSTVINQKTGVVVNDAAGVIKSATGITVYYMMQVTNTGNVYDKYSLSTVTHECPGKSFDPLNAEFNDTNGNPITGTGWLAPGKSYIFYFKLTTPTGSNPGKWSCNTIVATSTVNNLTNGTGEVQTEIVGSPQNPLVGLSKIDSKNTVEAGEIFTYTLYAFNSNDKYPANNFVINETYDPNITYISSVPAPDPGFNNKWSLGNLAYGLAAAKTITITVKVNENYNCERSITNNIWASYDGYSPGNPPRASIVTDIISRPDLEIVKSAVASTNPATKGSTITYKLDYINKGTCDAPGVEIKDYFDDTHTNVINTGGGIENSDHLSWNLGTLHPGQSNSITYTVVIDPAAVFAPGTTTINNTAVISTSGTESNYNNNKAQASISVSTLPDLRIKMTASPDLAVGAESTYTLTVLNIGDISAGNVVVKDVLPSGLNLGEISNGGSNNSGTITWPAVPILAVGDSVKYSFKVTPLCPAIPSVTNSATVTSSIIDKNLADNTCAIISPVKDNTPPVITKCPVTRNVEGCSTGSITGPVFSSVTAASSMAEFSDATNQGSGGDLYCGIAAVTYKDSESGTCSMVVIRTWTLTDAAGNKTSCEQTINVNHLNPPVVPANGSSSVACSFDAIPPIIPTVLDACGNTVNPILVSTSDIPVLLACEGTKTYTYSFTDCAGLTSNWVYTYTIEREDFTMPAGDGKTVACLADAVAPLLPTVKDNCGNILTPSAPVIGSDPLCEGTKTYTYTYTDCEGNTHDWVYTYTIEREDFTMPAGDGKTVACLADAVAPALPTVKDNCGNILTPSAPVIGSDPLCEGVKTYTYTYTDCEGNTHDWVYTYTIEREDFTMPAGDGKTVACLADAVAPALPTVKDNCGNVLTPSAPVIGSDPLCEGVKTYTYTYTDCEGNTHDWVYTYTIEREDFTMPAGDGKAVACLADAVAPALPTVKDNCGNVLIPSAPVIGSDPLCEGTKTYTYTYTDCKGNTHDWVYTYTIVKQDFVMPTNDGKVISSLALAVAPALPTVRDYCGNILSPSAPVISSDPLCEGTKTYTYTYTDCKGNAHDWIYTYSIERTDFTVPAGESRTVACIALATEPVPPSVNDSGGNPITPGAALTGGTFNGCEGTRTYTFTFTDCAGTSHDWAYTYTIEREDFTMPAGDGKTVSCLADAVAPALPTVKDNCGNTLSPSAPVIGTDPLCEGIKTYTYTYTDCEGTSHDWVYTYTIVKQDFVMPANGSRVISNLALAVAPALPTITDYCGNMLTPSAPVISSDPLCEGTKSYTYTYTDCKGNTHDWIYTYSIERTDFTVPAGESRTVACIALATEPVPPSVNDSGGNPITPGAAVTGGTFNGCEGTRTYTFTFTDCAGTSHDWVYTYTIEREDFTMPAGDGKAVACLADAVAPALPTVKDNCGNVLTPSAPVIGSDPLCEGVKTYTYTYTDCEGNTHDWVYTYTIEREDFTMPANDGKTVACLADAVAPALPTVKDNCGNILTPSSPVIGSDPLCEGVKTYTYTYTDCEGNTHDWVYTYIIVKQDFVMPANDGKVISNLTLAVAPALPTVRDYCGNILTPSAPVIGSDPLCEGTKTYTYTYTDCKGNTHDWIYTYSIERTDFTVPAGESRTVACIALATEPVPPSVNDSGGNPITPGAAVTGGTFNGCEGTRTYTFTFTDCAGTSHDWVYTYTIEREDFTIPSNDGKTVACLADAVAPLLPTVKDNCGNILTTSAPVIGSDPLCEGTKTYTYTYTDCEGNTHDWVYTYTIEREDFTIPSNDGKTVACLADAVAPLLPTVKDNCGNILTPSAPVIGSDPLCEGVKTYTYTYTDCEGNTHDWVYTYTIEREDFTMPSNDGKTVACLADAVAPALPTVKDNCGNVLTPSAPVIGSDPLCEGTKTYTYTYTDCEGNTHDWVYTYTIEREDFTMPSNDGKTVACLADAVAPLLPTVKDNCGNILTPSAPVIGSDPLCEGTKTYTYTYTDCEGNTHDWVYTYTIEREDFTMPAGDGKAVACLADAVAPALPTVRDNCGNILTPSAPVIGSDPLCEGIKTYTYTYTDCEGNTHDWVYTYTIEREDFTMPSNDGKAVACLADAVAPALPTVKDNCGNVLTPSAPVIGSDPLCEGTKTYTYTYTDCEGNTHDWVYTYTIEREDFTMPANGGSVVACSSLAIPPTLPSVTDACGNPITPSSSNVSPIPSGEGDVTYTYTYVDCKGNHHDWIYTYTIQFPAVSAGSYSSVCITAADILLIGSPAGGVWTGTGVLGSKTEGYRFDPSVGTQNLTYTYTDGNGCANFDNTTINIYELTSVSAGSYGPLCSDGADISLMGSPAGGRWTGTGVAGNQTDGYKFDPSVGTQTLTYTYTDGNNCEASATTTVAVTSRPKLQVNINGLILTDNHDGTDEIGNLTLCNTTEANIHVLQVADLNNVSPADHVKINQTFILNNVTFAPSNDVIPIGSYGPEDLKAALIDPTLPGTLEIKGFAFLDVNNNDVLDADECAGDWVRYVVNVNPLPSDPVSISSDRNNLCPNDNGNITLTATGGFGNTMNWYANNCSGTTIGNGTSLTLPSPAVTTTYYASWTTECGVSACRKFTVIVTDTEKPVIVAPAAVNVASDAGKCTASGVNLGTPVTSDNCSVASVTSDAVEPFALGSTTVTWTVTDGSGNKETATQIVTVTDTEKPHITAPPAVSVTSDAGKCTATGVNLGTPVTSDNCSVASVTNDAVEPFASGNTTVIWTVTDGSGNKETATQIITVTDTEKPHITAPAAVTVSSDAGKCTATGVNLGTPVTSDNCSVASVTNDAVEPFTPGNTTVTWTVTDGSGNKETATQIITVTDTEKPRITAPAAVNVNSDAGKCTATGVNLGTPVTSDNCSVASVTNDAVEPFASGNTTVTWTVTDGSGNKETATQIVTVTDAEKPHITAPAALTVNSDAGKCTATAVNLGTPVTLDNCSVASVTNDAVEPFAPGNTTVTWTVTDGSGNKETATQIVTVRDTEKPHITAPSSVNVNSDAGKCTATTVNLGTPVTLDNCSVASVTNDAVEPFAPGNTTVTWTVTDGSGNKETATQIITVTDTEKPRITAPAAVNVNSDAGRCMATGVNLGTPVISDNCSVASVTNDAIEPFAPGSTTITWTVTDGSGNKQTATQVVTVTDTEKPHITAPAAVTVNSDAGKCTATGVNLGSPVTSDNCSVASVTNDAVEPFASGNTTVTWTVTDGSGNKETATQIVTVKDTEKPHITAPAAVSVASDAGKCTATGVNLGSPVTSDNCSVASVINDAVEPFASGNTTVTWTVTDDSGNKETATQIVSVRDTEKPVINAPQSITVNADTGKNSASGVVLGTPVTSDNCSVASVTNDAVEPFAYGNTTVTWTVTDGSGNTSTATQLVKVIDRQNPVFTKCLAGNDQTFSANAGVTTYLVNDNSLNATASDNDQVATLNYTLSGATTGSGTSLQGVKFSMGSTNVVWTATDLSGNTSTCSYKVTVIDTENPVFTSCSGGQDINLETPSQSSTINLAGNGYDAVAVDNDKVTSLTYQLTGATTGSGTTLNNVQFNPGRTFITWTAVDASGNSASCQYNIVVLNSNVPPVAVDDAYTVKESAELTGDVRANDSHVTVPVENLQVELVNTVSHGKLTIGSSGSFSYTPGIDYIGTDHFTYRLCKDNILCDEADVSITVTRNSDCTISVPNGFSPDGDGLNEYFKIRCLYNYPNAVLKVFTRSGIQVYEQEHYGNIDFWGNEKDAWWNGQTGNKWNIGGNVLMSASYIYILELEKGDKSSVKTGTVFISK